MIGILLACWLLPGLVFFAWCLRAGHSRKPGDLATLALWALTWPLWSVWVALLRFLGFDRV